MDVFQKYDNTLAFFIGNENIAKKESSIVAPYLKAAARDMKAYRNSKGYRSIPVGYSAADIAELRPMLQNYFTCGGNSSETMDFFALNSYSWCDPSTFTTSTYDRLQEYAVDFPVPIFFSETGCNVPGPRVWDDQDAIFGPNMTSDWSGAIVYEWIHEQNAYGLVGYNSDPKKGVTDGSRTDVYDGWVRKGTPTPVVPDFANLKSKWATNTPTGVASKDYDANGVSTRDCPTSTEGGWWLVDGNVALPTIGQMYDLSVGFTSSPTASSTAKPTNTVSSENNDDRNDDNSGAGPAATSHVAGMAAALVTVMLGFALWM